MRLTVFEQGALGVRARADEAAPCVDDVQAHALFGLGERMGARIATWQGPGSLRLQQFVGMVRTEGLELEILPKLEGLPEPAQVRRNLLAMLAATQDLDVKASDVVGFLESQEPFFFALARLYCHRLLEAVRRGLRQEYLLHDDLLPYVRGKVHWPRQAGLQASGRLELPCSFDERSEDTPINRTLKAALLTAGRMLEGTRTASVVTELRHAMDGVAGACPSAEARARLRTDRMNRRLEPLLVLARLLLGNRNPDLGRSTDGDRDTYAMVWDMNVLFEEYVGRLARDVLEPQGLRVDLQAGAAYLAQEAASGKNAFLLRPDILVWRDRKRWLVADTKWKSLDPRQANLGVSEADVYQVLAYAHRFESERAVLVYPHHPALGLPGLRRDFVVQSAGSRQVRVLIVTLDLARLEDVPGQLLRELVGESKSLA